MLDLLLTANSMMYALRLTTSAGSFPRPLSAEEERYYLERWAGGDLEARNILVERNLRLVAHILKKYYASASDQDDLISIGTIGLIKAISTFDGSKGARLATYAGRCIQNEILMYFRSQRKSAGDISLSDYIETAGDGSSISVMDVLCSQEDLFEQAYVHSETGRMLVGIEEKLDSREREIIILRYGLYHQKSMTQQEVAEKLNISRSYVSRIEKKALNKLKVYLEDSKNK